MELMKLMLDRRSVRQYTGEPVCEEHLKLILQAGLSSPTGHNAKPWHFIVVRDKEMLKNLADCRVGSAKMLENADCAIVVLGDEEKTAVWVEDCSIALTQMHLMADALGVGSCWIQGRMREAVDGHPTEDFIREKLHFPQNLRLEAVLSLGMPKNKPTPHTVDELLTERIHKETF